MYCVIRGTEKVICFVFRGTEKVICIVFRGTEKVICIVCSWYREGSYVLYCPVTE